MMKTQTDHVVDEEQKIFRVRSSRLWNVHEHEQTAVSHRQCWQHVTDQLLPLKVCFCVFLSLVVLTSVFFFNSTTLSLYIFHLFLLWEAKENHRNRYVIIGADDFNVYFAPLWRRSGQFTTHTPNSESVWGSVLSGFISRNDVSMQVELDELGLITGGAH